MTCSAFTGDIDGTLCRHRTRGREIGPLVFGRSREASPGRPWLHQIDSCSRARPVQVFARLPRSMCVVHTAPQTRAGPDSEPDNVRRQDGHGCCRQQPFATIIYIATVLVDGGFLLLRVDWTSPAKDCCSGSARRLGRGSGGREPGGRPWRNPSAATLAWVCIPTCTPPVLDRIKHSSHLRATSVLFPSPLWRTFG